MKRERIVFENLSNAVRMIDACVARANGRRRARLVDFGDVCECVGSVDGGFSYRYVYQRAHYSRYRSLSSFVVAIDCGDRIGVVCGECSGDLKNPFSRLVGAGINNCSAPLRLARLVEFAKTNADFWVMKKVEAGCEK